MRERYIYNNAMLSGIVLLLAGIGFQSWKAVAFGALIGGAGGLFGVFTAREK